MNEHCGLLHNMSAPPKSVVKYEGLSGLASRGSPGGSGVTGVSFKNNKYLFGKPVRFELTKDWQGFNHLDLLQQLHRQSQFDLSEDAKANPEKHLTTLINQCANALPLPEGCAVIAWHTSHDVVWSDPLTALAILSKCTQEIWLRSKSPSLISALQLRTVSLLIPPNFASQLPKTQC